MFKFIWNRLPWRGEQVKARIEQSGREGARQAAEYVAERARFYCPVDTRELHDSIKVKPSMGGAVWNVVAEAPHAKHVEFGTTHHLPNGVSYFIPPNPFMRKAMADGRREFPRILKQALVTSRAGEHLGTTFRAV